MCYYCKVKARKVDSKQSIELNTLDVCFYHKKGEEKHLYTGRKQERERWGKKRFFLTKRKKRN